ncbi:MAG: hypothetical protein ACMUIA_12200 [bacterium]
MKKILSVTICFVLSLTFGTLSLSYGETPGNCVTVAFHLVEAVTSVPVDCFRKPADQDLLIKKAGIVYSRVCYGLYADAMDKLTNDIWEKVDGCSEYGDFEENDWIQDCRCQEDVYNSASDLLDCLRYLIYGLDCQE